MDIHVDQTVDQDVLDRLLAVGDAEMVNRLLEQIIADLTRMRRTHEPGMAADAKAAHEAKGLAATIGASRLARMAGALQASIESGVPDSDLQASVHAEIATVLDVMKAGKERWADS